MSLITWGPSLLVNIRQSDLQHKKLVEIINQLHEAMKNGAGQEQLDTVFESLTAYTRIHFADEEQLLEKHGYPVTNHKALHAHFIEQLQQYQQEFRNGVLLSLPVMHFLKEWLLTHIQGDDKKYGEYLNGIGIN